VGYHGAHPATPGPITHQDKIRGIHISQKTSEMWGTRLSLEVRREHGDVGPSVAAFALILR
jgi:hypothetical protein